MKKKIFLIIIIGIIILVSVYFLFLNQNRNANVGAYDEIRCSWEPEKGSCKAKIPRYYFDNDEGNCKEFFWGGCGGTVPFETLDICESVCE